MLTSRWFILTIIINLKKSVFEIKKKSAHAYSLNLESKANKNLDHCKCFKIVRGSHKLLNFCPCILVTDVN